MRRAALAVAALVALVSCSRAEPHYRREDLPTLVLPRGEAPKGTRLIETSSGIQTLEEFTERKALFKAQMQQAGFVTSYFNLFGGSSVIAVSFVVLFRTPDGAGDGLRFVEQDVREKGLNLSDRPAPRLGAESFAVFGDIQPGYPPGYFYAWRMGNAVFGLVAAGADPREINEDAVRALTARIEARAR